MLHARRGEKKAGRQRDHDPDQARITIEISNEGGADHAEKRQHAPYQNVDPEQLGYLLVGDLGLLDRRQRKSGAGEEVKEAGDDSHHRHQPEVIRAQQTCCYPEIEQANGHRRGLAEQLGHATPYRLPLQVMHFRYPGETSRSGSN